MNLIIDQETIARNQAVVDFTGSGFIGKLIKKTTTGNPAGESYEFEIVYKGEPGVFSCLYGPKTIFDDAGNITGYNGMVYECYMS